MIKFFRRLRQSLLSENKVSKYFLYAIGEIILVVIGILFALQINNWNENRKLNSKSLNYLKRLKVDLDNVSKDVKNSLNWTEDRFNQAILVLNMLNSETLPNSKIKDFEGHLKSYFKFQITMQNTTAYEEMLSSGDLSLIKNEWLRNEFANLSEERDFIMEVNQINHAAYKTNMEIMQKHIQYRIQNTDTDSTKVKVKYDFDAMVKDNLFINQISNQAYTWYDILRMYKSHQIKVNVLKDSIKTELKRYD